MTETETAAGTEAEEPENQGDEPSEPEKPAPDKPLTVTLLAALGVVFGDIGTSPLYAFRQCVAAVGGGAPQDATVLGILSLILWSLVIVVGLKYVATVMRAANAGEGGIAALTASALTAAQGARGRRIVAVIGMVGIATFLGDGLITPAISVLSAVEGLSKITPAFKPYEVPLALAILMGLIAVQSRGSERIGRFFGPVMLVWFAVLAGLGLFHALAHPAVFQAFDPRHALGLLASGPPAATVGILGAAFLTLTGAEALYADMGHFGRGPIRLDWFALVFPALVLNYLGQGALVLTDPKAASDPFYGMFPHALLYPAVALATMATVIASQAVISGAFTLVKQAIRLGLLPRLRVLQTSEESAGQVYLPQVNGLLALGIAGLVLGFRSSAALSDAYGIAVVTTMLATTLLAAPVAHRSWGWGTVRVALVFGGFGLVDLAYASANAVKIPTGGWVPLGIGLMVIVTMEVWRRGRRMMLERIEEEDVMLSDFIADIKARDVPRVEGTGVYLTGRHRHAPSALLSNLRHNRVLHARIVLLNVETVREARLPPEVERVSAEDLGHGFLAARLRFGFMERPDLLGGLARCPQVFELDPETTSIFVGRETPELSRVPELRRFEAGYYALLVRNAVSIPEALHVPPRHTVELGVRVEL